MFLALTIATQVVLVKIWLIVLYMPMINNIIYIGFFKHISLLKNIIKVYLTQNMLTPIHFDIASHKIHTNIQYSMYNCTDSVDPSIIH